MYFPYFRGKQYDLLAIRESANTLKEAGFTPIIEPVKESLNSLSRCLSTVNEIGCSAILIANPRYGDHSFDREGLHGFIDTEIRLFPSVSVGVLLLEDTSLEEIKEIVELYKYKPITFIHSGFSDAKELASWQVENLNNYQNCFIEDYCGLIYRKHFKGAPRILIKDGFKKRINREHPDVEPFSDLHLTFEERQMDGFGDFLTVGDDYSEGGGPAYAVAIHLTYIDPDKDDVMFIHHFKSIRQNTPTDPAGKFLEALNKLVDEVNKPNTKIFRSSAVEEFLRLHEERHFPGLGSVKKLSMIHHIELLKNYFNWGA